MSHIFTVKDEPLSIQGLFEDMVWETRTLLCFSAASPFLWVWQSMVGTQPSSGIEGGFITKVPSPETTAPREGLYLMAFVRKQELAQISISTEQAKVPC